jgi:hypothetical protein
VANASCDASNICVGPKDDGEACAVGTECASTHCVDTVCCNELCDGSCRACTAALTGGVDGTCANVTVGTDPDGDCNANQRCSGVGLCRLADGESCPTGNQCATGFCPADDGVCCDSACDGTCESCLGAATGLADGQCGPVLEGDDPDANCASNERCNGAGVCICGWQPAEPGGSCPGVCSGGCSGTLCTIDCSADQGCRTTIDCPVGFACQINCTGDRACEDAVISCPDDHPCDVSCACSGGNTRCCQDATINCSTSGTCSVGCNNASAACDGTDLVCGDNQCTATCHNNATHQPVVTCNNSCGCTECN